MFYILALGPKFNYDNTKITEKDIFEIFKSIESQIYKIPSNKITIIRNDVVRSVTNEIHNQQLNKKHIAYGEIFFFFLEDLKLTHKFLEDKDILVTRADEGNKTILVKKQFYVKEATKLLSNTKLKSNDNTNQYTENP